MARAHAGRLKIPKEQAKWSAMEDFVLESLVGKVSYRMIALRLGRSPSAVQRRASTKNLSARRNWATDRATRRAQLNRISETRLVASAEELAEYL